MFTFLKIFFKKVLKKVLTNVETCHIMSLETGKNCFKRLELNRKAQCFLFYVTNKVTKEVEQK